MQNINNFKKLSFRKKKIWIGSIKKLIEKIDILCVGVASYDLVFNVSHHPISDEKCIAENLTSCGGGPAANAAVAVTRLRGKSAFAGYLGNDFYGREHFEELRSEGVMTDLIVRGDDPTPLSVVLVKPNGERSVINYRPDHQRLKKGAVDFLRIQPGAILFDGHEPDLSIPLAKQARRQKIPTILDSGSVHHGTKQMINIVDYLICSEKFAADFTSEPVMKKALDKLYMLCPNVIITLGEKGLLWKRKKDDGCFPAFKIKARDTTGAGDTFHGALAFYIAAGKSWEDTLRFSSAAAVLYEDRCTQRHSRQKRTGTIPEKPNGVTVRTEHSLPESRDFIILINNISFQPIKRKE